MASVAVRLQAGGPSRPFTPLAVTAPAASSFCLASLSPDCSHHLFDMPETALVSGTCISASEFPRLFLDDHDLLITLHRF